MLTAEELVLAAEGDLEALADTLHDGPVQSLVVAKHAADAVVRGGDPDLARAAVQDALAAMRHIGWDLRARTRSAGGLAPALHALAERLSASGRPGLRVVGDESAAAAMSPAAAATAYRAVQALVRDSASAVEVAVAADAGSVVLTITAPAELPARYDVRVSSLGGRLQRTGTGVTLTLPDGATP